MSRSTAYLVIFLAGLTCACSYEKGHKGPTSPGDIGERPAGMVSITIDDGWRSTYQNAFPVLDGARLKSTNYIITGRLNDPDYIGRTEILSLQARGHEIGAHTRAHQDLIPMTPARIDGEVAGSRMDLLAMGVISVDTFAYPFGSYNGSVVQAVRNAGFKGARTANGGFNSPGTDKFLLARQNLGNTTTMAQVRSWLDTTSQNNQWLILVAHHVDQTNTGFSVTPEFFREIVNEITQRRIRVVTVSEGITIFPGPA